MVQNAQSDNEKASLMYQVELFKDKIEDMDEAYALLQVSTHFFFSLNSLFTISLFCHFQQKEHKDKHRECEETKREMMRIQQELSYNRYLLEERDKMIQVDIVDIIYFSILNFRITLPYQCLGARVSRCWRL